jgi:hypothetical protein
VQKQTHQSWLETVSLRTWHQLFVASVKDERRNVTRRFRPAGDVQGTVTPYSIHSAEPHECSRLQMKCCYTGDASESSGFSPDAEHKLLKSNISWNWAATRPLPELVSSFKFLASFPGLEGDGFSTKGQRKLLDFDVQLTKQALEIIARNDTDLKIMCEDFFRMSVKWFPVINKKKVFDQLSSITTVPDAHFSVLLLCMFLFTQFWQKNSGAALEALYFTSKGFHGLLQSTGRISVESLQAGLLITIYEHSHRLSACAAMSIGSCTTMAYALGLHKTIQPGFQANTMSEVELENGRRLWWGLVILERYVGRQLDSSMTRNFTKQR